MAKWVADVVLDAALDKIATATVETVCTAQPTTRAEAVTTYALADVALSGTDFTKADGATNGRKVTVAQKTGAAIDASGTASHVALSDDTTLLYVTTCTGQVLTSGNTMTFGSWAIEIGDPS